MDGGEEVVAEGCGSRSVASDARGSRARLGSMDGEKVWQTGGVVEWIAI
jgi:hypothetical protein